MNPSFSVVVASVGRPALLALQVQSLHTVVGGRPGWEVIVVADATRPDTLHLDDLVLQWVVSAPRPANDLRNIGAEKSTGVYLIFLDDDDFIYGNWAHTFESLNDGSDLLSVSADGVHERVLKGDLEADQSTRIRWPRRVTDRFGLAGASQLGGTFAVRRELFERVGGYRGGLPSLQHTEFFLRLIDSVPSMSTRWSDKPSIAIGERRGALKGDAELARRRIESASLIIQEHQLLKGRNPEVASFLDACAFYAHVAGRRRDEWRFSVAALRRRPSLKRWSRLLRVLTPVPRPGNLAPLDVGRTIPRGRPPLELAVVIVTEVSDGHQLEELCRTVSRVPGVAELVVVVAGPDCPPAPESVHEHASVLSSTLPLGASAARNIGLQRVRVNRVLFLGESCDIVPAGLALLIELAHTSAPGVSTVATSAQLTDFGLCVPSSTGGRRSGAPASAALPDLSSTIWPTELVRSLKFDESIADPEGEEFVGRAIHSADRALVSGFPAVRRPSSSQ